MQDIKMTYHLIYLINLIQLCWSKDHSLIG